jgi:hypothetical protein
MSSDKHCIASKTALRHVMIASLRQPAFGKAFAIIPIAAIIKIRINLLLTTARHEDSIDRRSIVDLILVR